MTNRLRRSLFFCGFSGLFHSFQEVIVTDFTEKYTTDSDEKILLRKIQDLLSKSRKHYSVVYSHFLNPAQQALIASVHEFFGYLSFVGGYDDAERRLARVQSEEYNPDDGAPICLFTMQASMKDAVLSHRDVLGSLMGLGLKREMIGDILPNGSHPQFFCHNTAADFIELHLRQAGRYPVTLSRSDTAALLPPQFEEFSVNVSSMRLDCLTAECFRISRSKAAEQIKKGLVTVNWLVITDPSHVIHPGDKLSLLGKGKVEIVSLNGLSKKGRSFVTAKRPL